MILQVRQIKINVVKLLRAREDKQTTKTKMLFVEHIVDTKERKNTGGTLKNTAPKCSRTAEEGRIPPEGITLKNDLLHASNGPSIKHTETKLLCSM